jgi:hypothetical protein
MRKDEPAQAKLTAKDAKGAKEATTEARRNTERIKTFLPLISLIKR